MQEGGKLQGKIYEGKKKKKKRIREEEDLKHKKNNKRTVEFISGHL